MNTPARSARALVLAFLVVVVAGLPLSAQTSQTLSMGDPEESGMSPSVLRGALGLYEEAVARGDLVGAVILVARRGRVVLFEPVGMRDEERRLPMERNTLFRMASNTKPVVATAVAQLVESGDVRYDALVREHLPGWDNYRSGFITVSHLLSHTSGLRIPTLFLDPLMEASSEHPDAPTLRLEADRYGEIGATEPPGGAYSYSNPGYNTLAALVEIASGQLLEDRLRSTIYEPLGMVDSYNHREGHMVDGKLDRMGAVYYERDGSGDWIPAGTPGGPRAYPFARGSGGMISTAWDYAIFAQMFLNRGEYGGERILSERSVETMTTPKVHVSGEGADAQWYGYGWSLTDGTFGHSGSDGTNAWIDPEREIIGLVFTQTPRGRNPFARFRRMVNLAVER